MLKASKIRYVLTLFFLVVIFNVSHSQTDSLVVVEGDSLKTDSSHTDSKSADTKTILFNRYLKKGDYFLAYGPQFYEKAAKFYYKALQLKPYNQEINLKIGECYLLIPRYRLKAVHFLEESRKHSRRHVDPRLDLLLAEAYQINGNLNKAIEYYSEFIDLMDDVDNRKKYTREESYEMLGKAKKGIQECKVAMDFEQTPVEAFIKNLGDSINTQYPEYDPFLFFNDTMLLFTSRHEETTGGGKADLDFEFYEDIMVSYKTPDGWTKAKPFLSSFNNKTNDAIVGISGDGTKLFTYRDASGGDLFQTEFDYEKNKWITPSKIHGVNTKYQESSAFLTKDGNSLYVVSDRPEGLGAKDIYVFTKNEKGKWTNPMNLGPTINTGFDEERVFIDDLGKTMYFSSKGHNSFGGYDIFMSVKDETGRWGKPENLGYPINSVNDDVSFRLTRDGRKGYYSSIRADGQGEKDIYMVVFPYDEKMDSLLDLRVTVDEIENKLKKLELSLANDSLWNPQKKEETLLEIVTLEAQLNKKNILLDSIKVKVVEGHVQTGVQDHEVLGLIDELEARIIQVQDTLNIIHDKKIRKAIPVSGDESRMQSSLSPEIQVKQAEKQLEALTEELNSLEIDAEMDYVVSLGAKISLAENELYRLKMEEEILDSADIKDLEKDIIEAAAFVNNEIQIEQDKMKLAELDVLLLEDVNKTVIDKDIMATIYAIEASIRATKGDIRTLKTDLRSTIVNDSQQEHEAVGKVSHIRGMIDYNESKLDLLQKDLDAAKQVENALNMRGDLKKMDELNAKIEGKYHERELIETQLNNLKNPGSIQSDKANPKTISYLEKKLAEIDGDINHLKNKKNSIGAREFRTLNAQMEESILSMKGEMQMIDSRIAYLDQQKNQIDNIDLSKLTQEVGETMISLRKEIVAKEFQLKTLQVEAENIGIDSPESMSDLTKISREIAVQEARLFQIKKTNNIHEDTDNIKGITKTGVLLTVNESAIKSSQNKEIKKGSGDVFMGLLMGKSAEISFEKQETEVLKKNYQQALNTGADIQTLTSLKSQIDDKESLIVLLESEKEILQTIDMDTAMINKMQWKAGKSASDAFKGGFLDLKDLSSDQATVKIDSTKKKMTSKIKELRKVQADENLTESERELKTLELRNEVEKMKFEIRELKAHKEELEQPVLETTTVSSIANNSSKSKNDTISSKSNPNANNTTSDSSSYAVSPDLTTSYDNHDLFTLNMEDSKGHVYGNLKNEIERLNQMLNSDNLMPSERDSITNLRNALEEREKEYLASNSLNNSSEILKLEQENNSQDPKGIVMGKLKNEWNQLNEMLASDTISMETRKMLEERKKILLQNNPELAVAVQNNKSNEFSSPLSLNLDTIGNPDDQKTFVISNLKSELNKIEQMLNEDNLSSTQRYRLLNRKNELLGMIDEQESDKLALQKEQNMSMLGDSSSSELKAMSSLSSSINKSSMNVVYGYSESDWPYLIALKTQLNEKRSELALMETMLNQKNKTGSVEELTSLKMKRSALNIEIKELNELINSLESGNAKQLSASDAIEDLYSKSKAQRKYLDELYFDLKGIPDDQKEEYMNARYEIAEEKSEFNNDMLAIGDEMEDVESYLQNKELLMLSLNEMQKKLNRELKQAKGNKVDIYTVAKFHSNQRELRELDSLNYKISNLDEGEMEFEDQMKKLKFLLKEYDEKSKAQELAMKDLFNQSAVAQANNLANWMTILQNQQAVLSDQNDKMMEVSDMAVKIAKTDSINKGKDREQLMASVEISSQLNIMNQRTEVLEELKSGKIQELESAKTKGKSKEEILNLEKQVEDIDKRVNESLGEKKVVTEILEQSGVKSDAVEDSETFTMVDVNKVNDHIESAYKNKLEEADLASSSKMTFEMQADFNREFEELKTRVIQLDKDKKMLNSALTQIDEYNAQECLTFEKKSSQLSDDYKKVMSEVKVFSEKYAGNLDFKTTNQLNNWESESETGASKMNSLASRFSTSVAMKKEREIALAYLHRETKIIFGKIEKVDEGAEITLKRMNSPKPDVNLIRKETLEQRDTLNHIKKQTSELKEVNSMVKSNEVKQKIENIYVKAEVVKQKHDSIVLWLDRKDELAMFDNSDSLKSDLALNNNLESKIDETNTTENKLGVNEINQDTSLNVNSNIVVNDNIKQNQENNDQNEKVEELVNQNKTTGTLISNVKTRHVQHESELNQYEKQIKMQPSHPENKPLTKQPVLVLKSKIEETGDMLKEAREIANIQNLVTQKSEINNLVSKNNKLVDRAAVLLSDVTTNETEIVTTETIENVKLTEDIKNTKLGSNYEIDDVLFEFDKYIIADVSKEELNRGIKIIKGLDNPKVFIYGHTDSKGSSSYNQALSERRAKAVGAYFQSKGVSNNSLVIKGFGESQPIAPNVLPDGSDNPVGRKLNRRTTVSITSGNH